MHYGIVIVIHLHCPLIPTFFLMSLSCFCFVLAPQAWRYQKFREKMLLCACIVLVCEDAICSLCSFILKKKCCYSLACMLSTQSHWRYIQPIIIAKKLSKWGRETQTISWEISAFVEFVRSLADAWFCVSFWKVGVEVIVMQTLIRNLHDRCSRKLHPFGQAS